MNVSDLDITSNREVRERLDGLPPLSDDMVEAISGISKEDHYGRNSIQDSVDLKPTTLEELKSRYNKDEKLFDQNWEREEAPYCHNLNLGLIRK